MKAESAEAKRSRRTEPPRLLMAEANGLEGQRPAVSETDRSLFFIRVAI